jgi:hypothetical protein
MKRLGILFLLGWMLLSPVWGQNPFRDDDETGTAVKPVVSAATTPENATPPLLGSSQDAIDHYSGKHTDPAAAWEESLADRNRLDPRNLSLRDAEHYWWARAEVQNAPWYLKPYKWFQQSVCTLGYSGYKAARSPFVENTTPPSWREMKYGLKGAWEGAFPPSATPEE